MNGIKFASQLRLVHNIHLPDGHTDNHLGESPASVYHMEVPPMPEENQLSRETFLYLAKEAGLDTTSSHMDELYPYVVAMLSSIEPLKDLDVSDAEPDMSFMPERE